MKKFPLNFQKIIPLVALLALMYACGPNTREGAETATEEGDEYYPEATEDAMEEEAPMMEAPEPSLAREKKEMPPPPKDGAVEPNTEEYEELYENPFQLAQQEPLSTFSIDVDNAAYSNIRRFIQNSSVPPPGAVRIEEMVNYFNYDYPQPQGEHPFSIQTEMATCPWNTEHRLAHIGIQGKSLNYREIKPCNLVFLIDASGSMEDANKLPLLKKSLRLLLDKLSKQDRIAIVAYAGAAGLVLPSTPASKKEEILNSLNELEAGGSTAGGEGIELAYKIAKENLIQGGNNRVILATDGDFNVGTAGDEDLVKLIEEKRKDDIYLTICGFGMGNYKDRKMEMISNAGNGNYFYIDNIKEAEKVFVKEMRANLFTIAKDVKIQIAFNPEFVKAYRLIGYENRRLRNQDFEDDTKDAGELGAGHTVTALYEIIPAGSSEVVSTEEGAATYADTPDLGAASFQGEVMKVRFRYKPPQSDRSRLIEQGLPNRTLALNETSDNFRFSAAVAEFGLLLRNSKFQGNASFEQVLSLAKQAKGKDREGYRQEFIHLVERAQLLVP